MQVTFKMMLDNIGELSSEQSVVLANKLISNIKNANRTYCLFLRNSFSVGEDVCFKDIRPVAGKGLIRFGRITKTGRINATVIIGETKWKVPFNRLKALQTKKK